ncbi:hypothetical protein [Streptomyces coeruleofuscus]|uniref:hypothetical protein n=1 Tax=Streptomyces coeruleofuscus TaxID=66879 RepID=UPI0031F96C0B
MELFEHVAAVAPGSYGLLQVRDDEEPLTRTMCARWFEAWSRSTQRRCCPRTSRRWKIPSRAEASSAHHARSLDRTRPDAVSRIRCRILRCGASGPRARNTERPRTAPLKRGGGRGLVWG